MLINSSTIRQIIIVVLISLISSCNGSNYTKTLHSVRGIEKIIQTSTNEYQIISSKGIGSVNLSLAKETKLTLSFFYSKDKPYTSFENIIVKDATSEKINSENLKLQNQLLIENGTIKINSDKHPVNWTVTFIDYYR